MGHKKKGGKYFVKNSVFPSPFSRDLGIKLLGNCLTSSPFDRISNLNLRVTNLLFITTKLSRDYLPPPGGTGDNRKDKDCVTFKLFIPSYQTTIL